MFYQNKCQTYKLKKQSTEDQKNKPTISTEVEEKIITEVKPSTTTSDFTISNKASGKKEKKSEKKDNVIKKITYVKSTKKFEKKDIRKGGTSNFKIYLSSRYHKDKPIEVSPKIKDQMSSIEDIEYNLHNLNEKKKDNEIPYKLNTIAYDKDIANYDNNNKRKEYFDNMTNIEKIGQNTYKTITNESVKMNNFKQDMLISRNKISPSNKFDGVDSSFENKKISPKKNIINSNKYQYLGTNSNSNDNNNNLNYSNNKPFGLRKTYGIEKVITNIPSGNNLREVSKLVKRFNKAYNPYQNNKGFLIKESQITLPGISDEFLNNKHKALSKMTKLSNILLSKKKFDTVSDLDHDSFNFGKEGFKFDKERSRSKTNSKNKNIGGKRFYQLSLAMKACKGPNIEDRTILRKNRNEKGGVVDLAQEKLKKKIFKIKKVHKVSGGDTKIILKRNVKYREKAAKIIQAWWRELKEIIFDKINYIIKIQSFWRGYFIRKYVYDIIYLSYIHISFCEKITKIIRVKYAKYFFEQLCEKKPKENIRYNNWDEIVSNIEKIKFIIIKKYFEELVNIYLNDKKNNDKIMGLVKIRAHKKNDSGKLKSSFIIWKYFTKIENFKDSYDINEINVFEKGNSQKVKNNSERDKFRGLLKIVDGVKNYHKKKALEEIKPKIKKYLVELIKIDKLKNIIYQKTKRINFFVKNYLYKWYSKIKRDIDFNKGKKMNDDFDNNNLRTKIFLRRIENVNNKQKKNLIRKYFHTYTKKILLLQQEEEKLKIIEKYKNLYIYNLPKENSDNIINDSNQQIQEPYKYMQNDMPIENKKRRDEIIKKNIYQKNDTRNGIINCYIKRWVWINKKLTQIDNAKIIQKFCKDKMRNKKGKELIETVVKMQRKQYINKLIRYLRSKTIITKLIEIYDKINNRRLILNKFYTIWKNNIVKLKERDKFTDKIMKIIEIKRIKYTLYDLNDMFLLMKLFKDISKTRGLYFIKKLKEQGKKTNNYTKLSNSIINSNNELLNQNKKILHHKILKIWACKILSNFCEILGGVQKFQKLKNSKEFFAKLYKNSTEKTKYNYNKIIDFETEPKTKKGINLRVNNKMNNKREQKFNKIILYKELTPFLVRYIDKKILSRKKKIFEKIRQDKTGYKFCELLKIFSKKEIIPDKEDLVDSLKYYIYMKYSKVTNISKFYNFIRRALIHQILEISEIIGDYSRLKNLIKITKTHIDIANDRWLLRIIKRWRFICFVKKLATKKMELMYKDLHMTYIDMADGVLSEELPYTLHKSITLSNMNMDKYLFDFNDPLLIKGAKGYKCIKKQFIFEPVEGEIRKSAQIENEYQTIEKKKDVNKTSYKNTNYEFKKNQNQKYYEAFYNKYYKKKDV